MIKSCIQHFFLKLFTELNSLANVQCSRGLDLISSDLSFAQFVEVCDRSLKFWLAGFLAGLECLQNKVVCLEIGEEKQKNLTMQQK